MENIVPSLPIQAKKAGRTRALNASEILTLALGALGTLSLTRGVKIANAEVNGKQVGIVVIEDVRFGRDDDEKTNLLHVIEGKT